MDMQMSPAATGDAASVLATAAQGFRSAWSSARGRLTAAEGALGNGPMGQAFLGVYRPGAPATVAQVLLSIAATDKLAQAGRTGVDAYTGADDAGRAAFEAVS